MHDFDQFERRLAAAIRSDADQGTARFEPASIARAAIASGRSRPLRGIMGTALTFGHPAIGLAYFLLVLALVLVVGAIAAGAFRAQPILPSEWTTTSSMIEARTWHTATLLPDGNVLVTGGSNGTDPLASAQLYEPGTGSWAATGRMFEARADHTATLLPDGNVLVTGGSNGTERLASAQLYDPNTGSWTATSRMVEARTDHTATLLLDGRVLVAGGFGVSSAELYDPKSGRWAPTGTMTVDRAYHTATLLPDGKVLVVGGFGGGDNAATRSLTSAEVYDPVTGTWTLAGAMVESRAGHTAMLLPSGRVLVAGGSNDGGSYHPTASAELYDPGTGSWTATRSMIVARVYAAATLLPDGTVLIAGGWGRTSNDDPGGPVAPAELYHSDSGSWTSTARMVGARTYPTATLLQDGTVLVTGGRSKPALGISFASAELYGSASGTR